MALAPKAQSSEFAARAVLARGPNPGSLAMLSLVTSRLLLRSVRTPILSCSHPNWKCYALSSLAKRFSAASGFVLQPTRLPLQTNLLSPNIPVKPKAFASNR